MLVIDEHSEIARTAGVRSGQQGLEGRGATPSKAGPFRDDDQYTLAVSLLATPSTENVCHITLMDLHDASDFFALHSGRLRLRQHLQRCAAISDKLDFVSCFSSRMFSVKSAGRPDPGYPDFAGIFPHVRGPSGKRKI